MIIIRQKFISREDIKNNPTILYVFGDNLQRRGFGGQAKEMRGEKNSHGIATKRRMSHGAPEDYFHDGEKDVEGLLDTEFNNLIKKVYYDKYQAIIVPADGIGTGLACLKEYAPEALEYINMWFERVRRLP